MVGFFDNLLTVAEQVLVLFLLIFLGYAVGKIKIFNRDTARIMGDFCLKFATPAVIIKSFMMDYDPEKIKLLLLALLAAIICHVVSILICNPLFRDADPKKKALYRSSAVLCNAGFMAMPMQEALLGSEGTFYGAAYVIVMTSFLWTYGSSTMSMGKEKMNIKKLVLNPSIIAVLLGLPIFVFSLNLPDALNTAITHVANLNTPLPMIVVGYYLSQSNIKIMFKNPRCFFVIAMRLLALPLICVFLLKLLGFGGNMYISTVIAASTPIAVGVTMFSATYDGDADLSANTVSLSTVFSIITMPLIIALAQTLA